LTISCFHQNTTGSTDNVKNTTYKQKQQQQQQCHLGRKLGLKKNKLKKDLQGTRENSPNSFKVQGIKSWTEYNIYVSDIFMISMLLMVLKFLGDLFSQTLSFNHFSKSPVFIMCMNLYILTVGLT